VTWDEGIDGPHLAIAASDADRIGILAGPGTGKTARGLMRRVARLLEQGVPPQEILLISFTRTAAHDLREKVANLGAAGAEEVRATTLHAYCFSILQRDAVLAITRRHPRPLLDHEVDLMLRDLSGDFGNLDERRQMLLAFEAGWARTTSEHPGAEDPDDQRFETAVLRWLRHHRAMLIGEVVPIAHAYLRDNPMAEERQRYRHVVVDEYQDLNALEQALLDLLAAEGGLCIAGDDDQSIYGFRYANPEGILRFLERKEVERIEIGVSGRCPRVVLAMANELIAHAPDRRKPPLEALKRVDGCVAIVQWSDLDEEVDGLTTAIAQSVERGRREPGDILVLVNRQRVGEMIRTRLKELDVPAHSFFSQESVSTDEAREALALLRLAVGDDPVSWRVILGIGAADGRAPAYARLADAALEHGAGEMEILDRLHAGERLGVRVPALLGRFAAAKARLDALPRDDPAAVIDALLPEDVSEVSSLREIAVEELLQAEDLEGLVERIIVRVSQHDVPERPDFVRIMSLHKSKGLTSPAVFLACTVDGVVPTIPSRLTEAEAEAAYNEQRRLVYVALTRAAEELVISSAVRMGVATAASMGVRFAHQQIRRKGRELTAPTIASPYLNEFAASSPAPIRGVDWLAGQD
jgi:DNA helicase II / ATP-dependent DNA helicase PcrA